jgi:hypothetical protein
MGKRATVWMMLVFVLFWLLPSVAPCKGGEAFLAGAGGTGAVKRGQKKARVLLVVSRRALPYIRFEEMVRGELKARLGPLCNMSSVYLDGGPDLSLDQGLSWAGEADGLVILIGTRASRVLHLVPRQLPVIVSFTVERTLKGLEEAGRPFWALSMEIPLKERLEVCAEIFPGMRAALFDDDPGIPDRVHGLKIVRIPPVKGLYPLLQEALDWMVDVLIMTPDARLFRSAELVKHTILWGIKNRIAVVGLSAGYVKNGALLAIEPDYSSLARQTAALAGRLMDRGLQQERVRIVVPDRRRISVNLRTARRIGIALPEKILQEADLIVE